jgi:hypothetical protein
MSKPVRLPDYLHTEIERLAKAERRSLANMVQVLLEQALQLGNRARTGEAVGEPRQGLDVKLGETAVLEADPGIEREAELSERGRTNATLGSREPVAGTRTPAPRSESTDDHFKPDPKK